MQRNNLQNLKDRIDAQRNILDTEPTSTEELNNIYERNKSGDNVIFNDLESPEHQQVQRELETDMNEDYWKNEAQNNPSISDERYNEIEQENHDLRQSFEDAKDKVMKTLKCLLGGAE